MRWASGQVSVSSSPVRDRSAHWQPLAAAHLSVEQHAYTGIPVLRRDDHALDGDALLLMARILQQAQVVPRVAQAVQVDQHLIQVGDGRKPAGWLRVVPWAERPFGWMIDRVGPLLLRKKKVNNGRTVWYNLTSKTKEKP